MNDDELRNRLARLDPQADAPVDPITSPRAQDLLERIMTTDTPTEIDSLTETQTPDRNRPRLLMALAAGVAAAGIVAAVVLSSGSTTTSHGRSTNVALRLPPAAGPARPGRPGNQTCVRFDVSILKTVQLAFAGTVTDVSPSSVTLDVTKWYAGGSAQQVTLTSPSAGAPAELAAAPFVKGTAYLVSAQDGVVKGCGYSGPATADLQQAYDQAFG